MRIIYWITNIAITFIIIFFVCMVVYSINGSLEMFPTFEQHEKARFAAICFMIFSCFVCYLLVKVRRNIKKRLSDNR